MNQTPRDAVQFTRESAERIAGVVRTVELATPSGRPMSFEPVQSTTQVKPFRMATFTAAWATGTQQVLTFQNQTTTPNTVAAFNQLYDVAPLDTTQPQVCAIAKEGTAWYFVNTKEDGGGAVRRATFQGAWSKGGTKAVAFASGETAQATNSLYAIPSKQGDRACMVANVGSGWQLLNEEQNCSTGKERSSLASAPLTLSDSTPSALRGFLAMKDGDNECVLHGEFTKLRVISEIEIADRGFGPELKCKVVDIWAPRVIPNPEYEYVTIPSADCNT
jgi:hypothetical protein